MDYNLENLVRLKVAGLKRNQGQGNYYGMVLQEENGDRRLQIVIGRTEAQSIECVLRGIRPPRPLTHDLMYSLMERYGIRLGGVVIDLMPEGVYSGTLLFDSDGGMTTAMDARSSDAVALAVRVGAPVYISPKLLDTIGVSTKGNTPDIPMSVHDDDSAISVADIPDGADMDLATMNLEQLRQRLHDASEAEKYEEAALIKAEITRRFPDSQTSKK